MPPVEVPAIEVSPYRIFKMLLNTGQRSSRKDARIQPPSSDGCGNSFASTLLIQRIALRTSSNEHSVQTRGCGESEPKCSRALSAIVEKAPLDGYHRRIQSTPRTKAWRVRAASVIELHPISRARRIAKYRICGGCISGYDRGYAQVHQALLGQPIAEGVARTMPCAGSARVACAFFALVVFWTRGARPDSWAELAPALLYEVPTCADQWRAAATAHRKSKPAGFVADGLFQPSCLGSELGRQVAVDLESDADLDVAGQSLAIADVR
jgi:hypothetical protein